MADDRNPDAPPEMITNNPTFDVESGDSRHRAQANGSDEVEAAAAALRELFRSEPHRADAVERLIIAREAALRAELEAKFSDQAAPGPDAIKAVVAHLSEAPTNWHQSVVYFAALPRDAEDSGRRICAMIGSVVIVLSQCMTVSAILAGTITPSCETNAHCRQGTYCSFSFRITRRRCEYCGMTHLPVYNPWNFSSSMDVFNETLVAEACGNPLRFARDTGPAQYFADRKTEVSAWCEACVSAIDMTADTFEPIGHMEANIAAMGPFDWVALMFATVVVALTVVGELKDIELVMLARRHANDKLNSGWRFAFSLLTGIRRWMFLPSLVCTVPVLVLYLGGDALSVCFNTVAVLFTCELDNVAYSILLNERVKTRVEERGRVELEDEEAVVLARSKALHAGLIVASVPTVVWTATDLGFDGIAIVAGVFWLGGIAETLFFGGGAAAVCKGVVQVTGAFVLGAYLIQTLGFMALDN